MIVVKPQYLKRANRTTRDRKPVTNKPLIWLGLLLLALLSASFVQSNKGMAHGHVDQVAGFPMPNNGIMEKALTGYAKLKANNKLGDKNILTVIDFSLSSKEKRMWVIDMENQTVLYHILVAHGKHSGELYARKFSNIPQSYQSSLGFYVTGSTYHGKHGLSLYLDGMEKGFNDKARQRAIVMHGAEYVSRDFIRHYGRLGRSFGCPSISLKNYKDVIALLEDKTCLFIYYPDAKYLDNSKLIK